MEFPFFENTRKASDLKKDNEKMERLKEDIKAVSNTEGKRSIYKYFNGEAIIDSLSMSADTAKKAKELIKSSAVNFTSVMDETEQYGRIFPYIEEEEKSHGRAVARVSGKEECDVIIEFNRKSLTHASCNCSKCFGKNNEGGFFRSKNENCRHVVAAVFLLNAYLESHELGDETNTVGKSFLASFEDDEGETANVKIVPKLIFIKRNGGDSRLYLQFKIGKNKLFMIKKYTDFIDTLNDGGVYQLGKNDKVTLNRGCFDEESKKYVDFIETLIDEDVTMGYKYSGYYNSRLNASKIIIDNANIDRIFELLKDKELDFTIESAYTSTEKVKFRDYNEKILIQISPIYNKEVFGGIEVEIDFPHYMMSSNYVYCYKDKYINRCDKNVLKILKPVYNAYTPGSITIGRKNIGRFYSTVLPMLKEYGVVNDLAPEAIQYIPEKAKITYYLDMEEANAVGRAEAEYIGGRVDIFSGKILERNDNELIRNEKQESKALSALKQYMPNENENGSFGTQSEDEIYLLKTEGIDALNKYGKVMGSDAFNDIRVYKKPGASIGVSVQSNLLQLEFLSEDLTAKELAEVVSSYKKKKKYYRLKSGAFVDLGSQEMSNFNEMLNVLEISSKDLRAGALTVPLYRSIYINEMMESHDKLVEKRDESFGKLIEKFEKIKAMKFLPPADMDNILRNYQKEGFKWLRTVEELGFGGILADDMGLGKTLQVISLLVDAKKEDRLTKALIVCPASLVYNWSEEISKFDKEGILSVCVLTSSRSEREKSLKKFENVDVYISSYDTLRRDIAMYHGKNFSHQIIDEAQFIKNQITGVARAVKAVNAKTKFALTGTPIENRLSELWSIFDFIMPGFLYSYTAFRTKYESPIVKEADEDMAKFLSKMISPFVLRRLKSQVATYLPEKSEEVRVSKFDKKQQLVYDTELSNLKKILEGEDEYNSSKMRILSQITRLRQICCDPSLVLDNYNGNSAKLESCIDLVKSGIEAGHKILLFSQFTSMLEIIKKRLDMEGIGYFVITGSTTKEKRIELVNQFNKDDTNIFLISLKAGGTGLNLVGADIVIHYDPWWNFAAQNQATDRAHRIGQKNMVTVYRLIAKGTIEEKIVKLQETKRDLADKVLNFEEGLSLATISREELIELLG